MNCHQEINMNESIPYFNHLWPEKLIMQKILTGYITELHAVGYAVGSIHLESFFVDPRTTVWIHH